MVGFNVLIEERESERNEDGLVEYLSEFLGGGVGGSQLTGYCTTKKKVVRVTITSSKFGRISLLHRQVFYDFSSLVFS